MMTVLCPYCYSNTVIQTNGYYCPNCKRIIDFFSTPTYEQMGYDKRMWSEKELKELIKETVKELGEENVSNID